jgi:predicted transcriptional regulator
VKRPVNLRLDENIIVTLNQLANELNTTKTEVVERALKLFSKTKQKERNQLLEFAGILKNHDANKMLNDILTNKNSKVFEINL